MKNIIFVAPPAAGKGTQSDLLVKKYGYNHISTGDLLRKEISEETELGKSIKDIISKGLLVSDEIVSNLLEKELSNIQGNFILDGYPRNISQAKMLTSLLNKLNINNIVTIYLNMSEDIALKRALGRIICPQCGRSFNKYIEEAKPKVHNTCDYCNVPLMVRNDDTEETFKIRFEEYVKNTEPLLNYYKDLSILKVIDNNNSKEETFKSIESVIE